MEYKIISLNDSQAEDIDARLAEYDEKHITYKISADIRIGVLDGKKLIAGASGCMTAFKIFYISTVYVDSEYRNKGIGKEMLTTMEQKAASAGANMIRLDTFDWQGAEFYKKAGYEQVGYYNNAEDDFSEYFFLKRIKNRV